MVETLCIFSSLLSSDIAHTFPRYCEFRRAASAWSNATSLRGRNHRWSRFPTYLATVTMIAEEPRHEMLTAERIEVLPSFGAPPKTSDLSEDQEISPSTSPLVSVVVPVARSVPSTIRRCLSS